MNLKMLSGEGQRLLLAAPLLGVIDGYLWVMLGMCIGLPLGMWAADVAYHHLFSTLSKKRSILAWSNFCAVKAFKSSARAFSLLSSLAALSFSKRSMNDNCRSSNSFWKRSWRRISPNCKKNPKINANTAPSDTSKTFDQSMSDSMHIAPLTPNSIIVTKRLYKGKAKRQSHLPGGYSDQLPIALSSGKPESKV
jgi:hypothetical protein